MQVNEKLSSQELKRYSRNILEPNIGYSGQVKFKNTSVLVFGCGGIGSIALSYLASSGFGTIGIIDFDTVDLSNLQRQIIYKTKQVNLKKTEMAKEFLSQLNPEINIANYELQVSNTTYQNALNIASNYEIIIDTMDSYSSRALVNKLSIELQKPLFSASCTGMEGHVYSFYTKLSNLHPCYNCIFPDIDESLVNTCSNVGILPSLAGTVGSMCVSNLANYVLNEKTNIFTQMTYLNLKRNLTSTLKVSKNQLCLLH